MQSGGYSLTFLASDDNSGISVTAKMRGRGDPDYGHTSKLLAVFGLCLANPQCHREGVGGGVMTPSSATASNILLERLRKAKHEGVDKTYPLLDFDLVQSKRS